MAFDGIVIASLVKEFNETIQNGRISKIAQPEKDELLLTIKGAKGQARLVLSASASLPLVYLTDKNKPSPMTAPNFCMLLRKHIANGKITRISQPQMERIIQFEIEHLDDLGDLRHKQLIVEIMGKHSNIIFCDEGGKIIDSIKHISAQVSSVREVLPGREYFIPKTQHKSNPLEAGQASFLETVCEKPLPAAKAIYSAFTGISPTIASEICFRASVDGERPIAALSEDERLHLYHHFAWMMEDVQKGQFTPSIIRRQKEPVEFSALELKQYADYETDSYPSISTVLETFFAARSSYTRIRQKSADLRKIVSTVLDRSRKKYDLQQKQLKDTEKREKYKVYGELIHTYGYGLPEGSKTLEALDYYTGKMVSVPLDPQLTPQENAKKYFSRYGKLKRTYEALTGLIEETKEEILHLESISTSLDIAVSEADLGQIKEELVRFGYIKKKHAGKKEKIKSKPFHYISSDGFHMYVGKNNFQNEELTFKFASGNDWWFHAKGIPGSHVVVKTNGEELPDRTFEEAGQLAAFYSKGRENEKVEIDYLERKHVKKPNGSKPGFVVYYTNYSLVASPDISAIPLAEP
ncbi:MAG: fibronectin/fibrinogen-binding protein [Lachnospiraceae bacterium]|jgi:predicted ribosome quality control (RQC) complex YloA/Tae2 family protein|nr:fibronectin/fibrinogen-binding protein [Lachnospiraceae bacterium]